MVAIFVSCLIHYSLGRRLTFESPTLLFRFDRGMVLFPTNNRAAHSHCYARRHDDDSTAIIRIPGEADWASLFSFLQPPSSLLS